MGDRYFFLMTCPLCGARNDVYYAPTCGFLTHTCTNCGATVDLEKYTGISAEDASNLDAVNEIIRRGHGR